MSKCHIVENHVSKFIFKCVVSSILAVLEKYIWISEACIGGGGGGTKYPISLEVTDCQISP